MKFGRALVLGVLLVLSGLADSADSKEDAAAVYIMMSRLQGSPALAITTRDGEELRGSLAAFSGDYVVQISRTVDGQGEGYRVTPIHYSAIETIVLDKSRKMRFRQALVPGFLFWAGVGAIVAGSTTSDNQGRTGPYGALGGLFGGLAGGFLSGAFSVALGAEEARVELCGDGELLSRFAHTVNRYYTVCPDNPTEMLLVDAPRHAERPSRRGCGEEPRPILHGSAGIGTIHTPSLRCIYRALSAFCNCSGRNVEEDGNAHLSLEANVLEMVRVGATAHHFLSQDVDSARLMSNFPRVTARERVTGYSYSAFAAVVPILAQTELRPFFSLSRFELGLGAGANWTTVSLSNSLDAPC